MSENGRQVIRIEPCPRCGLYARTVDGPDECSVCQFLRSPSLLERGLDALTDLMRCAARNLDHLTRREGKHLRLLPEPRRRT